MRQFAVVLGALRYEFGMQIRRPAVWVTLVVVSVLMAALVAPLFKGIPQQRINVPPPALNGILLWDQVLAMFLPVGIGLVVADRLARDKTAHVDEILDTLPASLGARLIGKCLGSMLATLVPVVLIYIAGLALLPIHGWTVQDIALAAQAFVAQMLPATIFVAGFSIAVPAVMRVPVYQFLFVGYWFWANLMSPKIGIPSPVATMLNAAGPWAQEAFFHFQWTYLRLNPTPSQGYESIALIAGLGLLALAGGWAYLRWQRSIG
jgi:ABC-type transport system involved in multi-copper enzyme maturation permease subunit